MAPKWLNMVPKWPSRVPKWSSRFPRWSSRATNIHWGATLPSVYFLSTLKSQEIISFPSARIYMHAMSYIFFSHKSLNLRNLGSNGLSLPLAKMLILIWAKFEQIFKFLLIIWKYLSIICFFVNIEEHPLICSKYQNRKKFYKNELGYWLCGNNVMLAMRQ